MKTLLALFFLSLTSQAAVNVDPKVTKRLDEMGRYLRSLDQFEVRSNTNFEVVVEDDQKADFNAKITYKVKRPDKLFAEIQSDAKHRQYFFDGKKLTIWSPEEKYYGEIPVKGKISDMVKKAIEYGIEMPLADLFIWGTKDAGKNDIKSATYVKEMEDRGRMFDQFAVRQGNIDWQVWLMEGDGPLPHKFVYTVNDDPARPRLESQLNWDLAAQFPGSTFDFKPTPDAHRIEVKKVPKKEQL